MAELHTCDLCGKMILHPHQLDVGNVLDVYGIKLLRAFDYSLWNSDSFELCEECLISFKGWFDGRRIKKNA